MTRYVYDAKSRIIKVINPSGTQVDCAYDGEDNLIHYQDEAGNVTQLEYRGLGEISRRKQADGTVVTYIRDTEERLTAVVNERGQTYQLLRDPRGRITEEIDYWGSSTFFRYGETEKVEMTIDPLGRETRFVYDKLGRLCNKIFDDGSAEEFEFDANGNLIGHKNQHVECVREFDAENRLLSERQGKFCLWNEYDAVGNRIKRSTSIGNQILYKYDSENQVRSLQINDEPPFVIARDDDGFTVKETFSNRFSRNYEHDIEGNVTRLTLATPGGTIADRKYEYDSVGNLLAKAEFKQGHTFFSYDPMGRVIKRIDPKAGVEEFLYDPAGDLLQSDSIADLELGTRKSRHKGSRYVHDAAGNLVEKSNANTTVSFEWDAANHLIKSIDKSGQATEYSYDAQSRRLSKSTDDYKLTFFWDGDNVLADSVKDGDAREFVYYPNSSEPLALIDSKQNVYYYHNDINGAPLELCSVSGEVVWSSCAKSTYGKNRNAIDNPLALQGQYYDEETSLYYNRFRYYDSEINAFISKDPLGLDVGDNLYEFAPNSWGWIDPLGLSCIKVGSTRHVKLNKAQNGAYRVTLKDGSVYIGKGGTSRARRSARRASRQQNSVVEKIEHFPQANDTAAFLKEAALIKDAGGIGNLLNKINSPGMNL